MDVFSEWDLVFAVPIAVGAAFDGWGLRRKQRERLYDRTLTFFYWVSNSRVPDFPRRIAEASLAGR